LEDETRSVLEELLEGLRSGEIRLEVEELPYPPDEWHVWQRTRCGRWMGSWLKRTQAANAQRLKTTAGVALYRAQGASEVLDSLEALLAEQIDPERGVAPEESDNASDTE
jgi:hypothetical protein